MATSASSSTTVAKDQNLFPVKLHQMLDDVEKEGKTDGCCVSWNDDGFSFTIHDPKVFARTLMKTYFNQTKYKSFQRQLNLYRFERKPNGRIRGIYTHKNFVRGNRSLCRHIRRAHQSKLARGEQEGKAVGLENKQTSMVDLLVPNTIQQCQRYGSHQKSSQPLRNSSSSPFSETPSSLSFSGNDPGSAIVKGNKQDGNEQQQLQDNYTSIQSTHDDILDFSFLPPFTHTSTTNSEGCNTNQSSFITSKVGDDITTPVLPVSRSLFGWKTHILPHPNNRNDTISIPPSFFISEGQTNKEHGQDDDCNSIESIEEIPQEYMADLEQQDKGGNGLSLCW